MAGLKRFVEIVRLFDEGHARWTVQDMASALGIPTSTVYRNVRELSQTGFLEPLPGKSFRLGPAFVEFERRFRLTDPLIRHGSKFVSPLVQQCPYPCVVVLSQLYFDTVMCTWEERSVDVGLRTSYEPGRPMPLLRGATSKAILAQLPPGRLAKLLKNAESEFGQSVDIAAFKDEMNAVRRRGYSITRGEVDEGVVGLASPISVPTQNINASLSIIMKSDLYEEDMERRVLPLLLSTASIITSMIEEQPA